MDGGVGLAGLAGLGHGHARCAGQRVLGAQGGCEVLEGLHLLGDGLAGLGGDAGEGRGDVVEQGGGLVQQALEVDCAGLFVSVAGGCGVDDVVKTNVAPRWVGAGPWWWLVGWWLEIDSA